MTIYGSVVVGMGTSVGGNVVVGTRLLRGMISNDLVGMEQGSGESGIDKMAKEKTS